MEHLSKFKMRLEQKKRENKIKYLNSPEDIKALENMNEELEAFSKESQMREHKSLIEARDVRLT